MSQKIFGDPMKYNLFINPYLILTYGFIFLVIFDSFFLGTIFKILLFGILVIIGLSSYLFQKKKLDVHLIFYFLITLLFMCYSLLMVYLRIGFLNIYNLIYLKFLLLPFILIFFNLFKVNTIEPFKSILLFFGIITIILFIFSFVENFENIRSSFEKRNITIFQKKYYSTVSFNFSPLFIISSCYFLDKLNKNVDSFNSICFLINALPLFISGERANIIIGMILCILFSFIILKKFRFIFLFTFFLLVLICYYYGLFNFFDFNELNNLKKLNLLYDYEIIFDDLNILLFGQGSSFYNYWTTLGYYSSVVEPTYFEILRMYGLVGSLLLVVLILYPFFLIALKKKYKFYKNNFFLILGFIFYLIISIVNPHLLNTHGFLIILILINEILNEKKYN